MVFSVPTIFILCLLFNVVSEPLPFKSSNIVSFINVLNHSKYVMLSKAIFALLIAWTLELVDRHQVSPFHVRVYLLCFVVFSFILLTNWQTKRSSNYNPIYRLRSLNLQFSVQYEAYSHTNIETHATRYIHVRCVRFSWERERHWQIHWHCLACVYLYLNLPLISATIQFIVKFSAVSVPISNFQNDLKRNAIKIIMESHFIPIQTRRTTWCGILAIESSQIHNRHRHRVQSHALDWLYKMHKWWFIRLKRYV